MKKFLFALFILLSANLVINASTDSLIVKEEFGVKYFTLDNGFKVYLNEDHSKPEVFGMVVTKAGGKNDPADATGMAHYMEHMLFKGTTELGTIDWVKEKPHIDKIFALYDSLGQTTDELKRKEIQEKINKESVEANKYAIPNEFSNILNSMGSTKINAGTNYDLTVFYNAFPPNQIEKWLEVYSHRFIEPVFRSFQAELEVVYEEKNMYSDMFFFNIQMAFLNSFYKNHPYGQQTLIGSVDDLKNPSLTKMYDFFKTYYVANNMALIITGDFNSEEIIPIIKEKFSRIEKGKIPEHKVYKEEPFNGRELVEKKLSPVSLGVIGFRTVPEGHPDEIKLEILNQLLTNENQTGKIDQLMLDNKLMSAMAMSFPFHDHGTSVIFFLPKIVGQKLVEAEELIINEIRSLRNGEFNDNDLEIIKKQLYKDYQLSLEDLNDKAYLISSAFSVDKPLKEIFTYTEQLNKITKEDLVEAANKYYGDNYLVLFSKMGFPKKEKIEKPGYEPVLSNTEAKSTFAKRLEEIPTLEADYKFIDFQEDITTTEIGKHQLFVVENPQNDIFSLKIKYGIGTLKNPMLKHAADLMNYAGTEKNELKEIKKKFGELGVSYYFSANTNYVEIELEGIEDQLEASLKLMNEVLTKPNIDEEKVNILYENEKSERKIERSEPDMVADALFDYLRFGVKSDYLNRLTMKKIKSLEAEGLKSQFLKALDYEAQIHYTGKLDNEKVKEIIKQYVPLKDDAIATESPVYIDRQQYNQNQIFVVHKKKAVQSKVFFFMNGKKFEQKDEPLISAFNMYFGGGFSGLVLQEIREYRSLAYTAGARYRTPIRENKNCNFLGYVGTQADKTNEAVEIFVGLVRNMPEKEERMPMIKDYLQLSAVTSKPHFRDLSERVYAYRLKGYDDDPNKLKLNAYKELKFNDILHFHTQYLQNNPMIVAMVGDKKKFDLNKLSEMGEVIFIKEKKLFSK